MGQDSLCSPSWPEPHNVDQAASNSNLAAYASLALELKGCLTASSMFCFTGASGKSYLKASQISISLVQRLHQGWLMELVCNRGKLPKLLSALTPAFGFVLLKIFILGNHRLLFVHQHLFPHFF